MVNVAVVGGTESLGRHILEAIYRSGKHQVILLTPEPEPEYEQLYPGLQTKVVDYMDYASLVWGLHGVHTIISVMNMMVNPEYAARAQKNLIRAGIALGVQRFVPSEWAGITSVGYPAKIQTRKLLADLNKYEKVLEYTLFCPGVIMDYLAHPYIPSKYMCTFSGPISMKDCEAVLVEGNDAPIAMTTVADMGRLVTAALDLPPGSWPVLGGFYGSKITYKSILELGESVRGCQFKIHPCTSKDLEAGNLPWYPPLEFDHPSIPAEKKDFYAKRATLQMLKLCLRGEYNVPNVFDRILPEVKLTSVEDFVTKIWTGK